MGEKGKRKSSCAVERGGTEGSEEQADVGGLLATRGHGDILSWLLTISRSVALQQPGSVLVFRAHVATKGHTEAWDLGHNLWPCWCSRALPPPEPC